MELEAYTIKTYTTPEGNTPVMDWLSSLDAANRVQILARVDRMKRNLGDHKTVKGFSGLYEARIFKGPGYRLYFTIQGKTIIVLLCGGDKKSQARDIRLAGQLLESLKAE